LTARAVQQTAADVPKLPSWSEQMRIRDSWLPKRYDMLLEMMRRHQIDMWIVVNEEFHDDPLTQYIAPPRPDTGARDIYVFIDTGEKGLKKVAIVGYWGEQVRRFFEVNEEAPATKVLPELYAAYQPKRIGLGIGGGRGVQHSLTHDAYLSLSGMLGPEATSRFVSAADLIEEYLDTRIPEEFEYYQAMVKVTDSLAKRVFSNEAITPGKTTVGDLRRWMYDEIWKLSARTWFQPDFRIYAKGVPTVLDRGYPAVAKESTVIERGQMLHIDMGITYMGFDTDWQRNAYVLREGERDAPEGLRRALSNSNALQDALMIRASRPGRTAGEVTAQAMKEMEGKPFEARIYCHPIGAQGHGLGTSIGYGHRPGSKRDPATMTNRLRKGSYITIELNTETAIPEWDGQTVVMGLEDDAYLTDEGWKFFVPTEKSLYLIK
jgi:Xaa-Pro aminopeptidase